MTTPTATGIRPGYQVTLSDGVNTVGIMAHTADTPSARAIRRLPQGAGVERKSIVQSSWMGGRGGYRFAPEPTRFYDSGSLWSMVDGYAINGPLPRWSTGALMHRLEADQPSRESGVVWQPMMDDFTYNYNRMARSFTPATGFTVRGVSFLLRQRNATLMHQRAGILLNTLQVGIYSDSAGSPNAPLLTGTIPVTAMNDILGTWLRCDFGMGFPLSGGTTYWIVIIDTHAPWVLKDTIRWEIGCHWDGGAVLYQGKAPLTTATSPWQTVNAAFYFRLDDANYQRTGYMHFFEYKRGLYAVSQSDDGAVARLWLNGDRGVATGVGQTTSVMNDTTKAWTAGAWVGCTLIYVAGLMRGESRTITSNSATGLTVSPPFEQAAAGGNCEYVILGSETWTEITGTGLTAPCTSVAVMNNIVYFAQGTNVQLVRMHEIMSGGFYTRTFAGELSADASADYLVTFSGDDTGKTHLYRARNSDVTFSRAEAIAWSSISLQWANNIPAGDSEAVITGMTVYNNSVYLGKEDKIGLVKLTPGGDQWASWADVDVPMNAGRDEHNGHKLTPWNTNLYFPFMDGFERLYGSVIDDIGPNRNEGMPLDRRGLVSDFRPVLQYGYVAIDAGATGYSSILATTSPGGDWHELYRCPFPGVPIRDLFYQSVPKGSNKLWFSEGRDLACLTMPRDTHTPLLDSNMRYAWQSYYTTEWIDGDTQDLDHYFNQIRMFTRNLGTLPDGTRNWIELDYQTDQNDAWIPFGTPGQLSIDGTIADTYCWVSPQQVMSVGNGTVTGKRGRFRARLYCTLPKRACVVNSVDLRLDVMHEVLYDFVLDFQAKDRMMLLSGADSRTRLTGAMNQLQAWQEDATVLTWRCVIPSFDNVRGHIDPVSLVPRSWRRNNVELSGSLTFKQTG